MSAQKKIIFIKDALHRNEETYEVEPDGIVEEVFEEHYPNKHMAQNNLIKTFDKNYSKRFESVDGRSVMSKKPSFMDVSIDGWRNMGVNSHKLDKIGKTKETC